MKDPAFLFYSQDFYTGVATLTMEDRGKYITLLCLMHQQGRMTEETICFLVGSVSDNLKSKFRIDEKGFWYNERLEIESEKRSKYTESRRINGGKGGRPKYKEEHKGKHKDIHMDNHMEDENEISKSVIYTEFYDAEIEKSKGHKYEENYLKLVRYLFGIGGSRKFVSVLKLRDQLLFTEFVKLMDAPKPPNGSIKKTIEAMENYKPLLKHSNTIYHTVLSYWDMDFKRIKK